MKTRFRFGRLVLDRLRWQATVECLHCGRPFTVTRGELAPVLRIGGEITGAVCEPCLTAESRQLLESMRREVVR